MMKAAAAALICLLAVAAYVAVASRTPPPARPGPAPAPDKALGPLIEKVQRASTALGKALRAVGTAVSAGQAAMATAAASYDKSKVSPAGPHALRPGADAACEAASKQNAAYAEQAAGLDSTIQGWSGSSPPVAAIIGAKSAVDGLGAGALQPMGSYSSAGAALSSVGSAWVAAYQAAGLSSAAPAMQHAVTVIQTSVQALTCAGGDSTSESGACPSAVKAAADGLVAQYAALFSHLLGGGARRARGS